MTCDKFTVIILVFLADVIFLCNGHSFDVSENIFGDFKHGVLAAFGDFNADKLTDVFVVADDGKSLQLLFAETDKSFTHKELIKAPANNTISSVVPADFDGDAKMDIMVTKRNPAGEVTVEIYWGYEGGVNTETPLIFPEKLLDQPLVFDANGDMIPDLLGEEVAGKRLFFVFSTNRNYTVIQLANGTVEELTALKKPQSSAFADVDGDLVADIMMVSESNGETFIEFWLNRNGLFVWNETVPTPGNVKIFGQATLVDIDADQQMDLILPVCEDDLCMSSKIYVLLHGKWHEMTTSFHNGDDVWGFVPPDKNPMSSVVTLPITLRAGDVDLDGYPDMITTLYNNKGGNITQKAFVLHNIRCDSPHCNFSRGFRVSWELQLSALSDTALVPAFFDISDDGILDILVTSYNSTAPVLHAFRNEFTADACFIKVHVVSGLCYNNCPHNRQPYGVNQPGPFVKYQSTTPGGEVQLACAAQLSQSAHFALQLPYMLLGLGQTPNYVDSLQVGIPCPTGQPCSQRNHVWLSVIPNSQLIIIPYPNDEPQNWISKLFITPSKLVLLTGAALLGTCGFVAGIVGILHWRERVEDKKEKLQEAHRFHFDAM